MLVSQMSASFHVYDRPRINASRPPSPARERIHARAIGREFVCCPRLERTHKSRTSSGASSPSVCHGTFTFTVPSVRLKNPTATDPSTSSFTHASAGPGNAARRRAGQPTGFWFTASTSGLVSSAVVHASLSGRFIPSISGDGASAQRDISVSCSSRVNRVQRSGAHRNCAGRHAQTESCRHRPNDRARH